MYILTSIDQALSSETFSVVKGGDEFNFFKYHISYIIKLYAKNKCMTVKTTGMR